MVSALDRQAAVVAAISTALRADAALAALIGQRIYDAPPARAVMPPIAIRLVTAHDASTSNTEAQTLVFDLDVWDRYDIGQTLGRPRSIMGHIRRILHMQTLAVAGVTILSVLCTDARGPFRDPDEVALHGVVSVAVAAGHESSFS